MFVALMFKDCTAQSNDFIRKIWLPRPLISAGRYTRESAIARAEETGELTAFGRLFISNVRPRARAKSDSAHLYHSLAGLAPASAQESAPEWLGPRGLPPAGGTARVHRLSVRGREPRGTGGIEAVEVVWNAIVTKVDIHSSFLSVI